MRRLFLLYTVCQVPNIAPLIIHRLTSVHFNFILHLSVLNQSFRSLISAFFFPSFFVANETQFLFPSSPEPMMPMVPLGLKETKEIDFREPFKVSYSILFMSIKFSYLEQLMLIQLYNGLYAYISFLGIIDNEKVNSHSKIKVFSRQMLIGYFVCLPNFRALF